MTTAKLSSLAVAITVLSLFGCTNNTHQSNRFNQSSQLLVNQLSEQLQVKYRLIDNQAAESGVDCAALGADWASCYRAAITLFNSGDEIRQRDWAIYFHSIRQILAVENEQFKITHLTGDLHKLEPTQKFTGLPARKKVTIPVIGEYWQLFETDVMPRWYVTSGNAEAKVIANTATDNLSLFVSPWRGDLWKRTKEDNNILMTADSRFTRNADIQLLPKKALRGHIIPTPKQVKIHAQDVDLKKGVNLQLSSLSADTAEVIRERFQQLEIPLSAAGYKITTAIDENAFSDEDREIKGAYQLHITAKGATVTGADESGIFYGLQSILSLLPARGNAKVALLQAKDAPRFAYRGFFLDVGRNFHSKQAVLRLLDQMAAYKLNKFHFHLSDDEGWRIEIPGLPELTEIGGQRCHDLSETHCLLPQLGSGPESNNMGSGFFSRADYIDIVKYAAARHIEVIPEIDMPAHARAAVVAMEARYRNLYREGKRAQADEFRLLDPSDRSKTTSVQFYDRRSYLNPCLDSSKQFVDKVIGEIAAMHKEAGVPLSTWHFGGDEAKNIRLGAGYQDRRTTPIEPGKGIIDQRNEDKPWAKSQACKRLVKQGVVKDYDHLSGYFALEVSKIVNAHGIEKMQAWQDGLKGVDAASSFATEQVVVNFWDPLYWGGVDSVNDWANKGYEVVISSPDYLYLDMPYEVDPKERGYYWATRFTDERKIFSFAPDNLPQNAETSVDRDGNQFSAKSDKQWPGAYGLSAQSWGETVRTDEQMEYMIYPRLLSVAERAWHRAEWEQDYQQGKEYRGGETHLVDRTTLTNKWQLFANLVGQRELGKLELAGITYRLPVPGGRIIDGRLEANISLPGVAIEYSQDRGRSWQLYDPKVSPQVTKPIQLRSVSHNGQRFSRMDKL